MVGQLFVPGPFPFLHGARRELLLASTLRIPVDFLRSLMSSDRHDLAVTRSKLCKTRRTGLTKSVRRAVRQPCVVTPLAEPIAKSSHGEWLSDLRHEVDVFPKRRRGIDDTLQLCEDRNLEIDRVAMGTL